MVDLKQIIDLNVSEYQKIWYDMPSTISKSLPVYDADAKLKNEKYIETFINTIYQYFLDFPDSEEDKTSWGKKVYKLVTEFGCNSEFINNKAISFLFSKDIKSITKEFIKRSKEFDDEMTLQEIGQAMRNVWIMNISQVLLNIEVKFTDSIFAYSMLYPYTDNKLDDVDLTADCKYKINCKLKKIIKGHKVEIKSDYENKIYELIGMINNEFARSKYENLFNSILAIQEAQENSISQQNKVLSPFEKDLLNISFVKGGTSVLADGYLVKGSLSSQEIKFMLGYGIMLQLCDDLQDVQEDTQKNNITVFSLTAKNWALDNIANKLINLIYHVIDVQLKDFQYEIKQDIDQFLKENCLMLAFLSMNNSKKFFSRGYINDMEKYMPFRFCFLDKIKADFKKNNSKIKRKYKEDAFIEMINYI